MSVKIGLFTRLSGMRPNLTIPAKTTWCVASGRLLVLASLLALGACGSQSFMAGELPQSAANANVMLAVPPGSG